MALFQVGWTNHQVLSQQQCVTYYTVLHCEAERAEATARLLQSGALVDLSLACREGRVAAHKLVLCTASPVLAEILQAEPLGSTVLYLNTTKLVLSSLVQFIYTGQASVPADSLDSFMDLAKELHVSGLNEIAGRGRVAASLTKTEPAEEQRQAGDTTLQEATVEDSREAEETRLNSEEMSLDKRAAVLAEYEQSIGQFVSGQAGCFTCTTCSYTAKKAEHVAEHAESRHIQGYSVSCLACSKVFRTRVSYRFHSCHVKRSLRQYQVSSVTVPPFTLHCCAAGSPEPRGKQ